MVTPAFDTHKAVKTLKSAGFDDLQAEAVVATVDHAFGEGPVTKRDLDAGLKTTNAKLEAMKGDLNAKLEAMKDDLNAKLLTTTDELNAKLLALATKDELNAKLLALATKDELNAKLLVLATKDELTHFATKADLYRALWIQGVGIIAIMATLRLIE